VETEEIDMLLGISRHEPCTVQQVLDEQRIKFTNTTVMGSISTLLGGGWIEKYRRDWRNHYRTTERGESSVKALTLCFSEAKR
jgi:hypothetical protein